MKKRTLLATLIATGGIVISTGVSFALYQKLGEAGNMKISTQTISEDGDLNYTLGDAEVVESSTSFANPLTPLNNHHQMSFDLGAYRGADATTPEQKYTLGRVTVEVDFGTKAFKDACTLVVKGTGYEGTYYGVEANKGQLVAGVDETASTESKTVLKGWYTVNTQHTQSDPTTQALLVDLTFNITDSNMLTLAESEYSVDVTWQDQSTSADEYTRPYIVGTQDWSGTKRDFAMVQNIGKTDAYEWMFSGYVDNNDNPGVKVKKGTTYYPDGEGTEKPISSGVSYDAYWIEGTDTAPRMYEKFVVDFSSDTPDSLWMFAWGTGGNMGEYPGMKADKDTNGKFVYTLEAGDRTKYQNVLFNNGKTDSDKTQTADILVNGVRHWTITGIDSTKTPKQYILAA